MALWSDTHWQPSQLSCTSYLQCQAHIYMYRAGAKALLEGQEVLGQAIVHVDAKEIQMGEGTNMTLE